MSTPIPVVTEKDGPTTPAEPAAAMARHLTNSHNTQEGQIDATHATRLQTETLAALVEASRHQATALDAIERGLP